MNKFYNGWLLGKIFLGSILYQQSDLGIEPVTAGLEARKLPICYAVSI